MVGDYIINENFILQCPYVKTHLLAASPNPTLTLKRDKTIKMGESTGF